MQTFLIHVKVTMLQEKLDFSDCQFLLNYLHLSRAKAPNRFHHLSELPVLSHMFLLFLGDSFVPWLPLWVCQIPFTFAFSSTLQLSKRKAM